MEHVGAVVIGAGVVGLAIARALANAGHAPLILEGEPHFGTWTSSRNSEVIHAGIYYPDGSLKSQLCVAGKAQLYAFCEARGVPYRRCGKLIFARCSEQSGALDTIQANAVSAGVNDLLRLDAAEVIRREPALRCSEALYSPSTGIIDSHAYMLALLGEAEAGDALLVKNTQVSRVERRGECWHVHIKDVDGPALSTPIIVNAAGLNAQAVAAEIDGLDPECVPRLHLARGVYFSYAGRAPFQHLIYPVPEAGGLGTHLTIDMAGSARFGPDVEWIDEIDYSVEPGLYSKFLEAAQAIWPELDPLRLQPGYAGIRPKLSGRGEPAADFRISGPDEHRLPGLVNLFGIESPGLTASMAIADLVEMKLR